MKKIHRILCASFLLSAGLASAQVGIGTTTPAASAALDITATGKGLLIPRMATAARTGIASPATGLQVYDTDTKSLWYYDGTAWVNTNRNMAGPSGSNDGKSGLVPAPTAAQAGFFLRTDGWGLPNTFTGAGTNAGSSGMVPAPAVADKDKFLKGNGTWTDVPVTAAMTAATATVAGAAGTVPAPPIAANTKFLRGDATWAAETAMTAATASVAGTAGNVPAPPIAAHTKFLRGDATWADVPAAATASNGLTAVSGEVKLGGNLSAATTITTNTTAAPTTPQNLTIMGAGDVGIGAAPTDATQKLTITNDVANAGLSLDNTAGAFAINANRAVVPTGVADQLQLRASGYSTGTVRKESSMIVMGATSAWTPSSTPGQIQFFTTSKGSTSPSVKAIITESGSMGVGTSSPATSSALEIASTSKGFLPPRMTTAQRDAILSPATGLTIYNTTTNCLDFYNGIGWYNACGNTSISASSGGSAVIAAIPNSNVASAGTLTIGVPASGVTQTVQVNVGTIGSYSISFTANGLTWTSTGTFTATGLQNIVFNATGTPVLGGTNTFNLNTVPSASFTRTVACVQIASTTIVSGGLGDAAPFNIKELTANQSGTWSIVSGGGSISGNIYTAPDITNNLPVTVTLRVTATSPCTSTADISFVVSPCFAKTGPDTYDAFMCHNLGATTTLDPHVPVQGIHGNYYQWGRSTVVANASTAAGAISGWNTTVAGINDWSLASKTANDPCPVGFRVPSDAKMVYLTSNNTTTRSGTWLNSATDFGSAIHYGPSTSTKTLTLPVAGYRLNTDGSLNWRNSTAWYWTAWGYGTDTAATFNFNQSLDLASGVNRTYGLPVRCIAE